MIIFRWFPTYKLPVGPNKLFIFQNIALVKAFFVTIANTLPVGLFIHVGPMPYRPILAYMSSVTDLGFELGGGGKTFAHQTFVGSTALA